MCDFDRQYNMATYVKKYAYRRHAYLLASWVTRINPAGRAGPLQIILDASPQAGAVAASAQSAAAAGRMRAALLLLAVLQLPLAALGCDAGVFWGANCTTDPISGAPSPACSAHPAQANATSSSTTLIWEEGGKGFGGRDDLGGDVFLSTTLNMGCGSGYCVLAPVPGPALTAAPAPADLPITSPSGTQRPLSLVAQTAARCTGTARR
eukprot:SAG11_NODE_660_length_7893_cov_4.055042_7_plen_208_part_00